LLFARVGAQYSRQDFILIILGLHVEPNVPLIPGIENLKGEAFHSSQYKGRAQLTGQDVLIMGCGETGMGMRQARRDRSQADKPRCCLRSHQS
jgi:dimethylaniline monooxygenase (N-oxide forming)